MQRPQSKLQVGLNQASQHHCEFFCYHSETTRKLSLSITFEFSVQYCMICLLSDTILSPTMLQLKYSLMNPKEKNLLILATGTNRSVKSKEQNNAEFDSSRNEDRFCQ